MQCSRQCFPQPDLPSTLYFFLCLNISRCLGLPKTFNTLLIQQCPLSGLLCYYFHLISVDIKEKKICMAYKHNWAKLPSKIKEKLPFQRKISISVDAYMLTTALTFK